MSLILLMSFTGARVWKGNVALFFFICYYKDDYWYPLKNSDTKIDEKHKCVMIFHFPSWQMSRIMMEEIHNVTSKVIEKNAHGNPLRYEILKHPIFRAKPQNIALPIGFQPFMRCSMQNGYGIYMRESTPLQQDYVFEKLRFRHNEKLANWIFEEMQGGKLIYPHEGLTKAQFVIDKIRDLNEFSEEALRYAVYRSHYYRLVDIDKARRDLQSFSVDSNFIKIIDGHPWKISSGRRKKIDLEYADFSLERIYGARILTRKNTSVTGMFAP